MASNNTDNVMDELAEESSYLSLDENGQRNWLEESKKYLDAHYPNWKNPQSTRMVPLVFSKASQATQTGYEAEEKMFNLIEEFGQKYSEHMFVVQSYKFAALIENAKTGYSPDLDWVKGECDYVIIHRRAGLLFIEVKAGITQTAFASGLKQIKKVKDVVSSYCAKDDKLKEKASKVERTTFAKKFKFVAMPNCSRQESFHCGIFKEDCQDVDAFKKWWDQNVVRTDEGISQEVYEALTARIVPITHVAPTLDLQIEETHRRIIHYTPNQLEIMLQSCPQQWITGPAGCGKTVLLIDKVKEVISNIMANKQRNQERVLVLCYYKPLAVYLSNEINDWFLSKFESSSTPVKIKTYSSFMEMVYRTSVINRRVPCVEDGKPDFDMIRAQVEETFKFQSPPDKDMFDHIFVDEGQDFRGEWQELLVKFHKKPDMTQEQKYQSYFWVMCDSNQHVQFRKRANLPWTNLNNAFRLTGVLRNTKKIFLESKKHFDGLFRDEHITLGHKEVGLNVKFDDTLLEDRSNGVDILSKQILYLHREKVKKNDVIILSRDITKRKYLMENLLKNYAIEVETAEQRLISRNNVIAVESIRRFKGLESKVVIVYDPEYSAPTNQGLISKARELLYIAMSRCVCYLVIVSTKEGCRAIQTIEPSRELMDRQREHGHFAYSNESRSRSLRYESEEEEIQSLGRRARSRSPLKTVE